MAGATASTRSASSSRRSRLLDADAPFVFEFGYSQANDVSALVEAARGFRLDALRLDAAGIPRTATAVRL